MWHLLQPSFAARVLFGLTVALFLACVTSAANAGIIVNPGFTSELYHNYDTGEYFGPYFSDGGTYQFNQSAYGSGTVAAPHSAVQTMFAIRNEGRTGRIATQYLVDDLNDDLQDTGTRLVGASSGHAAFRMEWDEYNNPETIHVAYSRVGDGVYAAGIGASQSHPGMAINVPANTWGLAATTFEETQLQRKFSIVEDAVQLLRRGNFYSGAMAVVWGVGGLPGLVPTNPLLPDPEPVVDSVGNPVFSETRPAAHGLAHTFTLPVVDGFGLDSFVYLDPDFASGYEYTAQGSRFSKFILPDALPGGSTEFHLVVDNQTFNLFSGQAFDFTAIDSRGVTRFSLTGIPLSASIDPTAEPPFVSGVSFTDPGTVIVTQRALVNGNVPSVPEPSSLALFGMGGLGLLARRLRKRRGAPA